MPEAVSAAARIWYRGADCTMTCFANSSRGRS